MVKEEMRGTGLKRKSLDKFYTSERTVNECIKIMEGILDINNGDICIEPSAGNGAFIKGIKSLFDNYVFYDIEPGNDEIITMDYLDFDYTTITHTYAKMHVVGNPPFGRQSSLAIKFIKKSTLFCDSISFILPKSFKKESFKKHFPLSFHLEHEFDLPVDSFLVEDRPHNVPCVFQVWVKKDFQRTSFDKIVPFKYKFVKKENEHDISFRRVGFYAGEIDRNTSNKSQQSHYFIKFEDTLTSKQFDEIATINHKCKNDTVGAKSISKQELIRELNKIIK